jgi:Zinc-finger of C2H2 type/Zinc finger, C2H2 type
MQKAQFENNSQQFSYLDGFFECSGVNADDLIDHVDRDPKICKLCMFNLESAFTFRALCRQANTILHQQQTMEELTVAHETLDDGPAKVKAKDSNGGKKRSRTTQCIECNMYFAGTVAVHNQLYHPEMANMEFNCERCNKSFNNPMSLKNHRNQKCFRKSQMFNDEAKEEPSQMIKLERPATPSEDVEMEGTFSCERCYKSFDNPLSLKHHMNQQCFRKSRMLDDVPDLEDTVAAPTVAEYPDMLEKFCCERCNKPFDNPLSLKHHRNQKCFRKSRMLNEFPVIPIKQEIVSEPQDVAAADYLGVPEKFCCERCNKPFDNPLSLKCHMNQKCFRKSLMLKEASANPPEPLDLEGKFCCERCNKPFDNPNSLKNHMNQKCFRKSRMLNDLPPVDLESTVVQPIAAPADYFDLQEKFCCERCNKPFDNPLSLKCHMNQKCFRKSKMQRVEPIATATMAPQPVSSANVAAITKFSCPRCKKSFKNRNIFLSHKRQCYARYKRIRNGRLNLVADADAPDVRYEDICGKKVKLYKCPECFKYLRDLVTHRQMHSDVRHNCDLCDKSYKFKHDLQKHILTFHPE